MSETATGTPQKADPDHLPLGGLLRGKRALVTGVANDMSIAWAIAKAFHAEGAELAFTYPGEAIERRMRPLVETLSPRAVVACDVGKDQDIERAVRAGLSVVSTCEELAWPWLRDEAAAEALDRLCEERNVAVLGTGVNPGFVLDRLAVVLGHATGPVRHVRGLRVVDATSRRASLRRKTGAGLDEEAFHAAADRGEVGHVGLAESAALCATGLGLAVDEVDEELVPLVAEEDGPVARGQVAGFSQTARVFADEREVVRLELVIALGAEDPRDEVELDADPPLRLVVPGGVPGDLATAGAAGNAAPAVIELRGLVTVLDLPAGR